MVNKMEEINKYDCPNCQGKKTLKDLWKDYPHKSIIRYWCENCRQYIETDRETIYIQSEKKEKMEKNGDMMEESEKLKLYGLAFQGYVHTYSDLIRFITNLPQDAIKPMAEKIKEYLDDDNKLLKKYCSRESLIEIDIDFLDKTAKKLKSKLIEKIKNF